MASTRNINSKSDYNLQYKQNKHISANRTYFGRNNPYCVALPCAGINVGHMQNYALSKNAVDIESFLYGVNSTDLVNPQKQNFNSFKSDIKQLPQVSFFNRLQTFLPEPLVIENNMRPKRP
jgi:hypothetical protein